MKSRISQSGHISHNGSESTLLENQLNIMTESLHAQHDRFDYYDLFDFHNHPQLLVFDYICCLN